MGARVAEPVMTIILNHTIVPARSKSEASPLVCHIFNLSAESAAGADLASGPINDTLKLLLRPWGPVWKRGTSKGNIIT